MSVADIVKAADPAIVRISTANSVGTGFLISSDGYIVTNNHVVEVRTGVTARTVTVILSDGTQLTGTVAGTDARDDIALVKIDGTNYKPLQLGDLSTVNVGDDVVAIGYALDLKGGEGPSYTVTRGIVSAKNRPISETSAIAGAIQTDAAINHGNSGGPLLNMQAQVIGMNTAIAPDPTTGEIAPGIGFAIGVDTLKAVTEELEKTGQIQRGYLGITDFQALRPAQARQIGLPDTQTGVYLSGSDSVVPGDPASKAGLKTGDVIVGIDGATIRTESDISVAMIREDPGKTVGVDIYRGTQKMTLQVTLGTPPTS
jgi:S1-C subfamily serine protease